jgi:hypothetical protein
VTVLFALDAPPVGARVLEPVGPEGVREGDRVRLLGVPALVPQDEDDLFGRVVSVESARLELELDVKADLRGWGGAPVLSAKSGRVLGILEAAWPERGGFRLGAAPLDGVLAAAAAPLGDGRGRPFAAFAPGREPSAQTGARAAAAEPPAAQTTRDPGKARPAWTLPAARGSGPGAPEPEAASDPSAADDVDAEERPRAGPPTPRGDAPLLRGERGAARLELTIDYPGAGEVFGGATGGFVAGRALAVLGELRRFDVVMVLDTSGSPRHDGGRRTATRGRTRGISGSSTIRRLGARGGVAAARQLLRSLNFASRASASSRCGASSAPPGPS